MQARNKKLTLTIAKYPVLDYGRSDDAANIGRPVTVINGVPLYQSTGANSKLAKTWMPFLGLNGNALAGKRQVWIMKPHGGRLDLEDAEKIYPKAVIDLVWKYAKSVDMESQKQLKRVKSVLGRFGCLSGMAASASLGCGFWETRYGLELQRYLKVNFSELFPEHLILLTESDSHIRVESKYDRADRKRQIRTKAVEAVNGFLDGRSVRPTFFHADSKKRRKIYDDFAEMHQLKGNTI